jgi:adenylate cyclase class 2
MIEVELKFRTEEIARVRRQVKELGGKAEDAIDQADTYFAHPVRDFAKSDEALRIRVVGDCAAMTYKGPLLDPKTKSREETEIWFANGAEDGARFRGVLERLDFRPVETVKKRREPWSLHWQDRDFEIAFDVVESLGEFVELETASSKADFEAAKTTLLALADTLELQDCERRSYLSLLLSSRGN